MKRLAFLLLLVMPVTGCAPRIGAPVKIFEARTVTTFDFSPYLARGFLFTPEAYGGEHETLGFLEVRFSPRTTDLLRRADRDALTGWTSENSRVQPLLDQMYEHATALGANAVTYLVVGTERDETGTPTYRLSGYAIRRP